MNSPSNKKEEKQEQSSSQASPEELYKKAVAFYKEGKYPLAIKNASEALKIFKSQPQESWVQQASCHSILASAYRDRDPRDLARATANCDMALKLRKKHLPEGHKLIQDTQEKLNGLKKLLLGKDSNLAAHCLLEETEKNKDIGGLEEKRDYMNASAQSLLEWSREGDRAAQFWLGEYSLLGNDKEGILAAPDNAIDWYKIVLNEWGSEASELTIIDPEQDDLDREIKGCALYRIAGCYEYGIGVPKNKDKAEEMYRMLPEGVSREIRASNAGIFKRAKEIKESQAKSTRPQTHSSSIVLSTPEERQAHNIGITHSVPAQKNTEPSAKKKKKNRRKKKANPDVPPLTTRPTTSELPSEKPTLPYTNALVHVGTFSEKSSTSSQPNLQPKPPILRAHTART